MLQGFVPSTSKQLPRLVKKPPREGNVLLASHRKCRGRGSGGIQSNVSSMVADNWWMAVRSG